MTFDDFAEDWDRRFAAAWPIEWELQYPTLPAPAFRESDAPPGNIVPPAIVPHLLFSDANTSGQARSFAGWSGRTQMDMWAPADAAAFWTARMRPVAWGVAKQLEGQIFGLHLQGNLGAPRTIERDTGRTVKAVDLRLLFTSAEEAT